MTHPVKAAITVGEPNWTPLELLLPACELEKLCCLGSYVTQLHKCARDA
jgi:hypothetical protein